MKTTVAIWLQMLAAGVVLLLLVYFPPNKQSFTAVPSVLMDLSDSWIARLVNNLLGYAIIIVPGFIIKKLVQKKNYLENSGGGCTPSFIRLCFYGDTLSPGTSPDNHEEESADKKAVSSAQKAWLMIYCFLGLQSSYLIWGLLQERIMTVDYKSDGSSSAKSERFRDSQFLVFVNRILAFILAGLYVLLARQPKHKAPTYRYSFCSFSNIMSSWCQYEALKYVNFPIQVLAKASKIIPVMLMGKLVSKKTYDYYEYVSAVIISSGMTLFLLGNEDVHEHGSSTTTFSGVLILSGYMLFDSFTANWQSELFKQHQMTHMQMMCGVNMFSVLFTSVSLFQQGGFVQSWTFMWDHPAFVMDIVILSLTSATGQLFIFYTISKFGAVVFTIMMTIRQLLAIILSCIIYHHAITPPGVVGIFLVFGAIFLRMYCAQRKRQLSTSVLHKV